MNTESPAAPGVASSTTIGTDTLVRSLATVVEPRFDDREFDFMPRLVVA